MANSLGSLVVRLGLDAVDFVDGLSKREREAQRFAQRLKGHMETGAKAAGVALGVMVTAVGAAAVAFDALINQAAKFQDLAEETNASAEAIASFAISAAVAGVSIESVAGAMNKLTKNLTGVDDESKAAGAALKALGINVKEFKDLDPATQYEAIGKALGEFEDSASKTAVAMALFGKSGAEQLKVFKALEEAGGRQIILTAEQIRQADEYADRQARVKAELNAYAQAISVQALPALTALTEAGTNLIKGLLGIDNTAKGLQVSGAILNFAEGAALALGTVLEAAIGVAKGVRAIAGSFEAVWADVKLGAQNATPALLLKNIATGELPKQMAERNRAVEVANKRYVELWNSNGTQVTDAIRKSFAAQRRAMDPENMREADRFARQAALNAGSKQRLNFNGAVTGGGAAAKAAAERQTEAERYLESLQRQLDKTKDLNVEETLLAEIASGRLKITGKVTEAELVAVARRIDAAKEEAELLKLKRDATVAAGDAITKANEKYQAQLDKLLSGGPEAKLEEQREAMLLLADAFEKGAISAAQFNDAATGFLGLNKEVEKGKSLAEDLGLTFASAFEDAIVGGRGLRDILKGLESDIIRIITRKLVTEPLTQALSGVFSQSGGGGGFLAGVGDFIGKLFSGGRAIGGPVEPGKMYRVNERGPELLDVNGQQFLMAGNQRGRVTPLMAGNGGSAPIVVHVTAVQGMTRATADQQGAMIGEAVRRSLARNR